MQGDTARKNAQEASGAPSFVLTDLDVYNWGAFGLRHNAAIDSAGTAIIGPTGSGKTTLVDALMTLIAPNPRYNLASTGGHESDRDLVSYVRGVSGAGNNSGDNDHIARPGYVVSGIAARFHDGKQAVRIGAIFWFDGTSSAAADLKRRWFFCEDGTLTLDDWLQAHQAGGARALKQLENETPGLKVHDSKQAYLARLRGFFEVGENAFNLLNRAAGLKQLSSIDEVFRELVLDDSSAFEDALEVASQFDDLAVIHAELETARLQRDSLLPVGNAWQARTKNLATRELQKELLELVPRWFATHAAGLWQAQRDRLGRQIDDCQTVQQALSDEIKRVDAHASVLQERYLQVGGADIEQLGRQLAQQQEMVEQRRRFAMEYQRLTTGLELDPSLSAQALQNNKAAARARSMALEDQCRQLSELEWAAGAIAGESERKMQALTDEIREVRKRPASNVPPDYQRFRSDLAAGLRVDEEKLPFVAELIEVKADEAARWRGAIERAIGSHRLRVMVPSDVMEEALQWTNAHDTGLHVRLFEAAHPQSVARFFDDGYTRKLNFKPHAHREVLKHLLADIDRHCLDTPEALRSVAHGMTDRGLMSDRKGYFDKRDDLALDRNWMTGFDNRDRLAALALQLQQAEGESRDNRAKAETARAATDAVRRVVALLERLATLEFIDIDLPGAEHSLADVRRRLSELTTPGSGAQAARVEWLAAKGKLDRLQERKSDLNGRKGELQEAYNNADKNLERAARQLAEPLSDRQSALAGEHLRAPDPGRLADFDDLERDAEKHWRNAIRNTEESIKELEKDLVRNMEKAQKVDTGALSEAGTEIADVPHYLERLRVLMQEALPEKQRRFQQYLNQSSEQGVIQLLSKIDNEVSQIEDRIDDLNRTLRRVDFQPGRYLRLEPQRVVHQSLNQLNQAIRHLRAAALKDDQGEGHYRALRDVIDHLRDHADRQRRTLAAKALLDPRYRLQFAISVIERATGAIVETRTGSQGGSGGEKEIIASYVLTASLSYALCPERGSRPLFGTIVLDEAFSKSSQAVAGRIIRALEEFGLHALFVTPNKELRLLRNHTRSAILVHRRGQQATLTSLGWEELDAHAERRRQRHDEIAN